MENGLKPLLFNIFLEIIMTLNETSEEADLGGERIRDLRFMDDIALLVELIKGLQNNLHVSVIQFFQYPSIYSVINS